MTALLERIFKLLAKANVRPFFFLIDFLSWEHVFLHALLHSCGSANTSCSNSSFATTTSSVFIAHTATPHEEWEAHAS